MPDDARSAELGKPRIVVGVDYSDASRAALRWAVEEARRRGGELEAVMAWRPASTTSSAGRPPVSVRSPAEEQADAQTGLQRLVAAETGDLDHVRTRAVHGPPTRVLLEAAVGADLLVIGGRGSRLTGRLPWAVGQQVVRDAPCPVAVIPLHGTR